jgi:O-antigen/teichoic acid export membrane protein
VTYFLARHRERERDVLRVLKAPVILQFGLLTALQAVLLLILVRDDPSRVWTAALISLTLIPAVLGQQYGIAILQGQGRYAEFNVLRVLPVTAWAALLLATTLGGARGIVAIMVVNVVANCAAAIVTMFVALRRIGPTVGTGAAPSRRDIMRYGVKGYVGSLSPVETFRLDQTIIGLFLSARDLGLYAVALSFTNLPAFIAQSIGMMAFPHIARGAGRSPRRAIQGFFVLTLTVTAAVVVALEVLAGWLMPLLFGADFKDAVALTRILLIGSFFFGLRRVLIDAYKGAGRPGLGSIAEAVSWFVLAVSIAVLMPAFGVHGVAWASAGAAAASLLVLLVVLMHDSWDGEGASRTVPTDDAGPTDGHQVTSSRHVQRPTTEVSAS